MAEVQLRRTDYILADHNVNSSAQIFQYVGQRGDVQLLFTSDL